MAPSVMLPVGSHPDQLEAVISNEIPEEEQVLHNIPDSSVILHSLKQSREKWLTSIFPKFSAKAKGSKVPAITPPPHTIKAHGRFDLTIGPHIFPRTAIYEVHYIPATVAAPATLHPAGSQSDANPASVPGSSSGSAPSGQAGTPTSGVYQFSSDAFVTPALVNQVEIAAASNPVLANLLQQAAQGKASPDQLKTLGLLIQTLGGIDSQSTQAPPTTSGPSVVAGNTRDFDLIIEFQERPSDRWIFPRGPVICEEESTTSPFCNLTMRTPTPHTSTQAPSPAAPDVGQSKSNIGSSSHVVLLRWSNISPSARDLIFRWVGGDGKLVQNQKFLADLVSKAPKRAFLQYQLPDGPLLESIRAAVAPPYATKSIKPTHQDTARQRRRAAARKSVTASGPARVAEPVPLKRKKTTKAHQSIMSLPIACHSCGQTDVPLLMGGRYCRTCVDAGKTAGVPPVPSPQSTSGTSTPRIPRTPSDLQVHMYTPLHPSAAALAAAPTATRSPLAMNAPVVVTEQKT